MAKRGRKMLKRPRACKQWTKEEEDYLMDKWGTISADGIAKHLGRSRNAVIVRIGRLGLPSFLECGENPTLNQVMMTIYGDRAQGFAYTFGIWERNGLPYTQVKVRDCYFRTVNIDAFWAWAENHKDILDFSRFRKNALGKEPAWVDIKRKADYDERVKTKPHNEPWKPAEDLTLRNMYKRKTHTWREIARAVGRTEGACRRRVIDMGFTGGTVRSPIRKWTDEELATMLDMLEAGYSFRQIGDRLDRSARSVEGMRERLLNTGFYYRKNREEKNIRYVRAKGVSVADMRVLAESRYEIQFEEARAYGEA